MGGRQKNGEQKDTSPMQRNTLLFMAFKKDFLDAVPCSYSKVAQASHFDSQHLREGKRGRGVSFSILLREGRGGQTRGFSSDLLKGPPTQTLFLRYSSRAGNPSSPPSPSRSHPSSFPFLPIPPNMVAVAHLTSNFIKIM